MLAGGALRTRAYAKVNLHLGVAEVRPDGYHELASVFQSLDIADEVSLELREPGVDSELTLSGAYAAGGPADASNLAWRAVDAVAAAQGIDTPAFALHLDKGIPAAGGMAGGSADAAAALRLADAAFVDAGLAPAPLGEDRLMDLAAGLGSDVPFTLLGGTALGVGRGEVLTPMLSRGHFTWAIITNASGLSTPAVFAKLDELRAAGRGSEPHMDTAAVAAALISGNPRQLAPALTNDLQSAAFSLRPDLRKILETGAAAGALRGIVSGSGPTCAFLCEDVETAQEVIAQVTADNRGTRGLVATGPVPSAPVGR